jgi:hypothetical protein
MLGDRARAEIPQAKHRSLVLRRKDNEGSAFVTQQAVEEMRDAADDVVQH